MKFCLKILVHIINPVNIFLKDKREHSTNCGKQSHIWKQGFLFITIL